MHALRKLHFNGLDGSTGLPLIPAMTPSQLLEWIQGDDEHEEEAVKDELRTVREKRLEARERGTLGVVSNVDPLDVEQAGWGVIYHPETRMGVRDKLAPLVDARKGRTLTYQPGESSRKFRARHKQGPGAVDPKNLPYYLLIVASPDQIPFRFQYGLDNQHAVGRLFFKREHEYERYANGLLDYEDTRSPLSRQRRAVVFSPINPGDEATALSSDELAGPLAEALHEKQLSTADLTGEGNVAKVRYQVEHLSAETATRPALLDVLTRQDEKPALLFTAAHGLGYPKDHPMQHNQGAITCAEWPGPMNWEEEKPLDPEMYLSGEGLRALAGNQALDGLVIFSFGCYSAGTPRVEDFPYFSHTAPRELASTPFIAELPQQMLAQGALAFVGHVERTWGYSFIWEGAGRQLGTFQSTLETILAGFPLGHAMEYFNDVYASLARELTDAEEGGLLHQYNLGESVEAGELAELWTAHNDARAYVLFGDPYAHLKPALMASA